MEAAKKLLGKFDPESKGYDYDTARRYGMGPDGVGENKGHWGSVAPASPKDKERFNLPDESYMVLKGRTHKTFHKAVKGERDRGFDVKKYGDRYFSVPMPIGELINE
jgi:hypothetical protein